MSCKTAITTQRRPALGFAANAARACEISEENRVVDVNIARITVNTTTVTAIPTVSGIFIGGITSMPTIAGSVLLDSRI
jgi:hypothetical protein